MTMDPTQEAMNDLGGYSLDEDVLDKDRQATKGQQKYGKLKEGTTEAYVCPPVHQDLRRCHIELETHSNITPTRKGGFVACLRRGPSNAIFHEPFWKYLEPLLQWKDQEGNIHKIRTDEGCPVCEAVARGELPDECKAKKTWLWLLIPTRYKAPGAPWALNPWQPQPFFLTAKLSGELMDFLGTYKSVFNYDRTTFVMLNREGTDFKNTKYKVVGPEPETLRNPIQLTPDQRAVINSQLSRTGECYPFRIIRSLVKDRDRVLKIMRGEQDGFGGGGGGRQVQTQSVPLSPPPQAPRAPAPAAPAPTPAAPRGDDLQAQAEAQGLFCFKTDCDRGDEKCKACPFFGPCEVACYGGKVAPESATPVDGVPAAGAMKGSKYARPNGEVVEILGESKGKVYVVDRAGQKLTIAPDELLRRVEDGPVGALADDVEAELNAALAAAQPGPKF